MRARSCWPKRAPDVGPQLIARAWQRIVLTSDVSADALNAFVASAQTAGFLRNAPDLARLIEKP